MRKQYLHLQLCFLMALQPLECFAQNVSLGSPPSLFCASACSLPLTDHDRLKWISISGGVGWAELFNLARAAGHGLRMDLETADG